MKKKSKRNPNACKDSSLLAWGLHLLQQKKAKGKKRGSRTQRVESK